MNRSRRWIFWAALLTGLALRLFGISHDLAEGEIYHPDTAKQIAATELYLRGTYYRHYGYSDYDGYPFFNSHLVEYIVRVAWPVVQGVQQLTGLPVDEQWPEKMALYWITRLLSAFLATLLIWIVYRIGKENFDERVGELAAWFLALSPVDVLSAHYETCDQTATFFAILCVFFAMRIYRRGLDRDYLFAAFFGMCAFAAKYNAGMVMVAPMAAHALRQKRWIDVLGGDSFRQLAFFGAVAVVSLFLTIPSMFIHPIIVPQEIRAFLHHVSGDRYIPVEIRGQGLGVRMAFAMHRNAPVIALMLSLPLTLVSLLGLAHVLRWNKPVIVLYTLPLAYFVLGISLRPLASPVYHTLMTGPLFVICAVCLMSLFDLAGAWRRAGSATGILLIAISCCCLLYNALKQDFYFWHPDTRHLAMKWTQENVPASFHLLSEPYTFSLEESGNPEAGPYGVLGLESNLHIPRGDQQLKTRALFTEMMHPLKTFAMEDSPFSFFRNPILKLHVATPALLPGFQMPIFQPAPSMSGNEVIFDGGPVFIRDEKLFLLSPSKPVQRILVRTNALEHAVLVLQNGIEPSSVRVSFGGRKESVVLESNERRMLAIDHPRRIFPFNQDRFFYRFDAEVPVGRVRVMLTTSPDEAAVALYNAGYFTEACPLLAHAAVAGSNPSLATKALVASLLGGVTLPEADRQSLDALATSLRGEWTAKRMLDVYRISPDYLDALAFLEFAPCELPYSGFERIFDPMAPGDRALRTAARPGASGTMLAVPAIFLDPGVYELRLDARTTTSGDTSMSVDMTLQTSANVATNRDAGAVIARAVRTLTLTNRCDVDTGRIHFEVPQSASEVTIALRDHAATPLVVDDVTIWPDALASLTALGHVAGLLNGSEAPSDMQSLLAYKSLVALGDRAAATGGVDRAFDCYAAASRLSPELAEPAERLSRIRDTLSPAQRDAVRSLLEAYDASREQRVFHVARASFAPGVRLNGYRMSTLKPHRGGAFGLNLHWGLDRVDADTELLAVWVHFLNERGEIAFQADHPLPDDLIRSPDVTELRPIFYQISVPANLKPGTYKIEVGLCTDETKERLKVTDTALPSKKYSVFLPDELKIIP